MGKLHIFVFDEIFESMITDQQLVRLKALDVQLHIVAKKCDITTYDSIDDPDTEKILCINPDFVHWSFGASALSGIPGLKLIISSSDNISWLDTEYADASDVPYTALESLTTEYAAVGEYAVTMMMSLARNIPYLTKDGFPADYAHDFMKYQGVDIAGKTAGIVGLGNIGGAIAKLCKGLGMNVIYWSRRPKSQSGYAYAEVDDLLRKADVIFPTLKPNSQTKRMLPNSKLALIKHDAIVVSVVSGLIDNEYLARRVADKKLFGFGFGADTAMSAKYPGNVWANPDYAWATKHNMQATYKQFVEKIIGSVEK